MAVSVKHFQQLEKIRGWRQQAFVLSLAERSLPNLLFGLEVLGMDCPTDMQQFLAVLWNELAQESGISFVKPANVLQQLPQQLAERSEYGARPAEDVVQLLGMALALAQQPDLALARDAGHLSLQTVTRHIEFSAGEGLDEHDLVMLLDRHPLVKNELAFQRELQNSLRTSASLHLVVNTIRNLAYNGGVSNIGIALDD